MTDERLEVIRDNLNPGTSITTESVSRILARELLAEVDRHRAGVEAVRALITYDAELGGYKEGGPFVYRSDVLAALGASE